jgi:hypothetical protein
MSNHEGHEEHKEKQEVELIFLRELRFFVVRINSLSTILEGIASSKSRRIFRSARSI